VNDTVWIRKRAGCGKRLYLDLLIQKGFLVKSASNVLAECYPREETEKRQRREEKKVRTANADAPAPSFFFEGQKIKITESQHTALTAAFPWVVDLEGEYAKADCWLVANPDRHIRRFSQFMYNWVSRIPKPEPDRPMIPRAKVPF
jgi:hypothetical protein